MRDIHFNDLSQSVQTHTGNLVYLIQYLDIYIRYINTRQVTLKVDIWTNKLTIKFDFYPYTSRNQNNNRLNVILINLTTMELFHWTTCDDFDTKGDRLNHKYII